MNLRVEVRGGEVEATRVRSAMAHRGPKVATRAPIVQRAITPIVLAGAIEVQWVLKLTRVTLSLACGREAVTPHQSAEGIITRVYW
jgi:hypothetical protein